MTKFHGRSYVGKRIRLDGNDYFDCTFENCTFQFGGVPFEFTNCTFLGNIDWAFVGAAAYVIDMLQSLYRSPNFHHLVEQTIERIQSGTVLFEEGHGPTGRQFDA